MLLCGFLRYFIDFRPLFCINGKWKTLSARNSFQLPTEFNFGTRQCFSLEK